jgi:hypothetical protein
LSSFEGIAHNNDGAKMSFIAPVHLPNGALINGIGAAVCSEDESITDHDIELALIQTSMEDGTQDTIRKYDISQTACNTTQEMSGTMIARWVDNEKYTYHFRVSGIEGGTCLKTGFPDFEWHCDDRRVTLQWARVVYTISQVTE